MRAAVFKGEKEPLQIEEVEPPSYGPDDVLVETKACGICRSDWHAWQGDWDWVGVTPTEGQVFGHEPAGTVVEVGENVDDVSVGDSVAAPFNMSGGTCRFCRNGQGNICERLVPLGFMSFAPGAFAERFPLRNADVNAVKLPDGIDPVDVAGLGCRFATAFHALAHQADITPGDWVAMHGCGGVGLSAIHVADALGANIIAVDIGEDQLDQARELGADRTVNVSEVQDVPQAVKKHTEGSRGCDVSVDALGVADTCQNSVQSLDKSGQHIQIGLTTQEEGGWVELPIDNMIYGERKFITSFGMPPNRYDEIFRMMEEDKLDPGQIVSETVSLSEVPDVIQSLGDYGTAGIPVCNEF